MYIYDIHHVTLLYRWPDVPAYTEALKRLFGSFSNHAREHAYQVLHKLEELRQLQCYCMKANCYDVYQKKKKNCIKFRKMQIRSTSLVVSDINFIVSTHT